MKAFLKKLSHRLRNRSANGASEEPPADRHYTVSDLLHEMMQGKRREVGQPELDRAREYERSRIPAHYRFPRQGDLYESTVDQEVRFMTSWFAPYTGGGTAMLYRGERIRITSDKGEEAPIGVYALPVEYADVETRMVPADDRARPDYGGFTLFFRTTTLNETFTLIRTGNDIEGEEE